MTRRGFLQAAAGFGLGCHPAFRLETKRLIFVSMTGGPSQSDLFAFEAGSWTPDWMDPQDGFPRGLMPRLFDRRERFEVIRGLRAPSLDHRTALAAHPRCKILLRANRSNFEAACGEALRLREDVRIDFGSWDHHGNLYAQLRPMAGAFDRGVARLMDRGSGVRVVAMGEFGRRPGALNQNRGRDHHALHAALTFAC